MPVKKEFIKVTVTIKLFIALDIITVHTVEPESYMTKTKQVLSVPDI